MLNRSITSCFRIITVPGASGLGGVMARKTHDAMMLLYTIKSNKTCTGLQVQLRGVLIGILISPFLKHRQQSKFGEGNLHITYRISAKPPMWRAPGNRDGLEKVND